LCSKVRVNFVKLLEGFIRLATTNNPYSGLTDYKVPVQHTGKEDLAITMSVRPSVCLSVCRPNQRITFIRQRAPLLAMMQQSLSSGGLIVSTYRDDTLVQYSNAAFANAHKYKKPRDAVCYLCRYLKCEWCVNVYPTKYTLFRFLYRVNFLHSRRNPVISFHLEFQDDPVGADADRCFFACHVAKILG